MKLAATAVAAVVALSASPGHGFLPSPSPKLPLWTTRGTSGVGIISSKSGSRSSSLRSSPSSEDERQRLGRMREIMAEEAMDPNNMAASARAMQDMKPEDMDRIMTEMDGMDPAQREQLKSMGMDPELMKKSLQMMRENPSMMASAQKMVSSMSPEQLIEQSRMAQEQMKTMSPEDVELAAKAINSVSPDQFDAAAESIKQGALQEEVGGEGEEKEEGVVPAAEVPLEGSAADPEVIDSMFRVGELMSQPPNGGVTFKAFSTLPPIVVLSGDREIDLSARELAECWEDGSLGATRVDRVGFQRVWDEVRDYFEGDVMDEARKTAKKATPTAKKSWSAAAKAEVVASPATGAAATAGAPTPTVGASLTPEQISEMSDRVKNVNQDDINNMLNDMENMSPEQQQRMKAMGVDPAMMQKASQMMQNNPMMRKAAEAMMKNMSPEQMMKASQQAQEQLKNMSPEDYEKAMERMKKGGM